LAPRPLLSGLILGFAVLCLQAQDDSPPPSSGTPVKFTGVLDAFYSQDLNHPASGLAQFRNFDWNQGVELNAAELSVERDGDRFGFRLDAGYGEMFRIMNLADAWHGPNRYISQAIFSCKPLAGSFRLDFGKFYTSAGAEGPETYDNFNYSRSLLFTLGEPYYHFGLRVTVPLTKFFTAGVQLVNGCNDVRDNNSGKTVGLTSTLTRPKWGWSQVYLTGPEKAGTNAGFRRLYNSVLTIQPKAWASVYLETLWAMDRRVVTGKDQWTGVAKFSLAKHWSISPRFERFNDSTGFNTGTPQHVLEGTATLDYHPAKFLIARSEFRRDWSNQAVFPRDGVPNASRTQNTVLLGLIFVIQGSR
jgi:Putative beta-barrel porin-2, OmpL-like. bbp2